ncbi:antitoxin Xre/MbcA/ParS toxin-binding domain-containing protein [Pseudomonas canadensis]|uniref:antitoxin Xre/MbcA/ParS toxin-binding domain-containing protein n=1 Tax=Pseudomonas canadensis TaxID=915099 RepID=UPI00093A90BB
MLSIVAICVYSSVGCWSAGHRCYLGRYEQILSIAEGVFGNRRKAQCWLSRPIVGLSYKSPCTQLSSSRGYGDIHEWLIRIHHGICF